jgi:CubicO group peptidase (beta-lactamase class C family)
MIYRWTGFLLLLFLLSCDSAATGPAEEESGDLSKKIDAIVEEAMTRDQIVGTSIGIQKDGELILAKGYGFADLENRVEATEHTVYRLGSVTKQFTAAAIMILVEQGKIQLDDDLTKYLPDYPTEGHRIIIERLLNHTSGIKGYTEMGEKFWGKARLDLSHEEMIDLFSREPFEFVPGERYQYSNSAYYLLGVIIEKVSGMRYADFLTENIFEPLGLSETYYLYNSPIIENRAEGYEVRKGKVVNDDPLSMRLPFSAGALGSSVMDMLRWQTALEEHRLISAESYQKMKSAGTLNDGTVSTYGYGLDIGSMEGRVKVSHGGGINGFRAQLSHYPEEDLAVVVLCNVGTASPDSLESRITRAVLGIPEKVVRVVELSEEDLAVYAGTYDFGRNPVRFSIEDGALSVMGLRLRPIGNHVFLPTTDDYLEIIFTVEDGKAFAVRMEREGDVSKGTRVSE